MGRRHRHLQREAAAERKLYGAGKAAVHAAPATRPGNMTFQHRMVAQLEDGSVGYAMLGERGDDCLRAAIATCLQVPPNEVPDPDIDRRVIAGHDPDRINLDTWTRLLAWLQGRGLNLVYHDTPAVDCERWIGVWAPPLHTVNLEQIVDEELHRPDVTRTMRRKIYGAPVVLGVKFTAEGRSLCPRSTGRPRR
jgi:hypothetical protein